MAYENYSMAELEAKMTEIEDKLQEIGAKFDAALPGEYHFWGDGPEDFESAKDWYSNQIFGLYSEMGYVMQLIEKKRALIHAN